MMYYIEKDNEIVVSDDDRQRLVDTLEFMPEFTEADIKETDGVIVDGVIVDKSEYESQQELNRKKSERADAVSKITVTVDGLVFDGDENAQTRMGRAIGTARSQADLQNATGEVSVNYLDMETYWVLADNTIATVKIGQLAQALYLAGQKQTELWVKPYED